MPQREEIRLEPSSFHCPSHLAKWCNLDSHESCSRLFRILWNLLHFEVFSSLPQRQRSKIYLPNAISNVPPSGATTFG